MTPIPWLRDIEKAAGISAVKEMIVFRLKVTGVTLAWFNRWREEDCLRDWSRLKQDFPKETRLKRTADITLSEVMEVKQRVGEATPNYQVRMEANIALLLASPTDDGLPFSLEPQVELLLNQVCCRGLLPGHPFKLKNKDPEKTVALTYAAVAKYSEHNRYGESTFESRICEANPSACTLPPEQSFEHKGVKIEASKLAEFKTEFDKSATDQLSLDELTDMFGAWRLSSLEERILAGRAMKTTGYMNPVVARRVFGGTMLAQHIRGTSAQEAASSRHVTQSTAERGHECATSAGKKDTSPRRALR